MLASQQAARDNQRLMMARNPTPHAIGKLQYQLQHHRDQREPKHHREQRQSSSVNTSSGSSSGGGGYTGHLHHFYSHHQEQGLYLERPGAAMMDAAAADDDGANVDDTHLIDDLDLELSHSVEDTNNISELYGPPPPPPQHQQHQRRICVDSQLQGPYLSANFYARPDEANDDGDDDDDAELASRSLAHLTHYQLLQQPALATSRQLQSLNSNGLASYQQQHLRQQQHLYQQHQHQLYHFQHPGSFSYIPQQPSQQQHRQHQQQPDFQSRELTLLLAADQRHLIPNAKSQQEASSQSWKSQARRGKDNKMQSGGRQQLTAANHQPHQSRRPASNNSASGRSSRRQPAGGGGGSRSATPSAAQAQAKPALGWCGNLAKLLLFIANLLFWSAGIALGAWGILSLVDDHKYNLSQLLVFEPSTRMSLFQLLSWSFITLGCVTILVGLCGCSAILKNNRWILGLYIFLILAIFALDLATGLLAIIFQERLVANVRLRLVNKLRSDYGVHASFTAAVDYIQTRYECCGLEGHFDYDQSLWRLQRLGGFDATVARTCCHLRNTFDDQAHINPRPVNESMCQSTDVRFHQSYRYRKGCMDDLEKLIRQKIWIFSVGCGAVGAVILLSFIFATCFCRSIPSSSSRKSSSNSHLADSNHQDNRKQSNSAKTAHQRHYS